MKEKAGEVGPGDLREASGWLWVDISLTANVTKGKGCGSWKGDSRGWSKCQGIKTAPRDHEQGDLEDSREENGEM